jgi:hypothetical protein
MGTSIISDRNGNDVSEVYAKTRVESWEVADLMVRAVNGMEGTPVANGPVVSEGSTERQPGTVLRSGNATHGGLILWTS